MSKLQNGAYKRTSTICSVLLVIFLSVCSYISKMHFNMTNSQDSLVSPPPSLNLQRSAQISQMFQVWFSYIERWLKKERKENYMRDPPSPSLTKMNNNIHVTELTLNFMGPLTPVKWLLRAFNPFRFGLSDQHLGMGGPKVYDCFKDY